MIDVFFCTVDYQRAHSKFAALRTAYKEACRVRWLMEPEVGFHVLFGDGQEFQRERRIKAEVLSRSPIYVCTDDDCLIADKVLPLEYIQRVFDEHPEYIILSAMPSNCNIVRWEGGKQTADVMEHHSVGGLRFCRKGFMPNMPKIDGAAYDGIQAEYLRDMGFKVGYLRAVPYFHLGEGFSSVWQ